MFSICNNSRVKSRKNLKNLQRISKIKPFIGQYEWKNIDIPTSSKDWKKFEEITRQLLLISYLYHTILNK